MAEAYATFAARGQHCDSVAITKVVSRTGQNIKVPGAHCRQVIEKQVADGVTLLLRGVMQFGTGTRASLGRPAAGKTGTTNRRVSVWFVGYTPELSTAVWAGNPSPPRSGYPLVNRVIGGRYYGNVCGGCLPGPIWRQTMRTALEDVPPSDFTDPPFSVVQGSAIRIPDVAGLSSEEAVGRLAGADLATTVAAERVHSTVAPDGTVSHTDPAAGAAAYPGQPVVIYLSGGPPPPPPATPAPASPPPQALPRRD
jgi:membrane peptidoglycan carboxypeptidase